MNASVGAGLNELKDWHRKSLQWRSQLLNKIKRVASQPVMSSGGAPGSMAQAAEAALALATGLSGGGSGTVHSGPKECRKAD
jgi:pyridoxal biosynthesis lyase PdxS